MCFDYQDKEVNMLQLAQLAQIAQQASTSIEAMQRALEVARLAAKAVKVARTATALREGLEEKAIKGRTRRRRRPSEAECSNCCPACLEQCPEAQGNSEATDLLSLVCRTGRHFHHGVLYRGGEHQRQLE